MLFTFFTFEQVEGFTLLVVIEADAEGLINSGQAVQVAAPVVTLVDVRAGPWQDSIVRWRGGCNECSNLMTSSRAFADKIQGREPMISDHIHP